MTGFDMAALLFVALGAATGFVRGFVQEVLALSAWIFAIFAIRMLHTPLTYQLEGYLGDSSSVSILAFALLLLVPYIVVKMVAKWAGSQSRKSVLGPIDRVLGFGFGAMKGIIIIVLAFSVLMLGYDTVWGVAGRPDWVTQSRTYPFINASSEAMVQMISERRTAMLNEGEGA